MAIESSPLEELSELLAKHAPSASRWLDSLPTLRARASATSVILQELAQTPASARPRRTAGVRLVLAAPSKEWAENVECRLREALPQDATVRCAQPGERLPHAPPPPGCTVRREVVLPKSSAAIARRDVLAALSSITGLEIDYSEPIDLIVVAPALDAD